jgi:hypothetical protein
VEEELEGATDAEPEGLAVEAGELDDVDDEVDVDVEVVFVCVEVELDVDVEVDVLIGDRLDAGASLVGSADGASVVLEAIGERDGRLGTEIEREALGRFDPPPHEAATTRIAEVSAIVSARNARSRSRTARRIMSTARAADVSED